MSFLFLILAASLCYGVGRKGTIPRPPNPWSAKWDTVVDGVDQTSRLWVENKRNVLIMNCTVHDLPRDVEYVLRVERCTSVVIINNTVRNCGKEQKSSGISIGYYCKNVHIVNNTVHDVTGSGIITGGGGAKYPDQGPNLGTQIRGNLVYNVATLGKSDYSPQHGMYIKAKDALVENNVVYHSYEGSGLSIRSTGIYRNNLVYNCRGQNIAYWKQKTAGQSKKLIIENNVLYEDNKYPGPSGKNNSLSSLLFLAFHDKNGREKQHFDNFVIRFNTIVAFNGCNKTNSLVNLNTIKGGYKNVKFYGNTLVDLRNGSLSHVREQANCTYFAKNHTSRKDEGFANLAKRDFHLTKNHPAVNFAVGVKHGFPPIDKDSVKRSASSLDAGAYEYSGDRPPVFLNTTPAALTFGIASGNKNITVRSNTRWSAGSDRNWISINPADGSNNGTILVGVSRNNTNKARSGTVSVSGGGITQKITISQESGTTSLRVPAASSPGNRAADRSALTCDLRGRRIIHIGAALEMVATHRGVVTSQTSLYGAQALRK